jgi:hypothetical protein
MQNVKNNADQTGRGANISTRPASTLLHISDGLFKLLVLLHHCYFARLCLDHFTCGRLQDLTLASSGFNGFASCSSKSMCLNCNVLCGEVSFSNHNLVDAVLGLGDHLGVQKRLDF